MPLPLHLPSLSPLPLFSFVIPEGNLLLLLLLHLLLLLLLLLHLLLLLLLQLPL
jgi:hypothetical protein